jgi:hypothetical protein
MLGGRKRVKNDSFSSAELFSSGKTAAHPDLTEEYCAMVTRLKGEHEEVLSSFPGLAESPASSLG